MSERPHNWDIIGQREPFFGVISTDELRSANINADARRRFYESGENEISDVLKWFERDFGARPTKGRALDIGCGVGRLSYAMANVMPAVTGYDVSTSMLEIARANAPPNLELTSRLTSGPFSWIHSYIVFQHIPPAEGVALIESCLDRAGREAFISIQLTLWRDGPAPPKGIRAKMKRAAEIRNHRRPDQAVEPLIEMHDYDLAAVVRLFSTRRFDRLVLRPTLHGVHHGAWILAHRS